MGKEKHFIRWYYCCDVILTKGVNKGTYYKVKNQKQGFVGGEANESGTYFPQPELNTLNAFNYPIIFLAPDIRFLYKYRQYFPRKLTSDTILHRS